MDEPKGIAHLLRQAIRVYLRPYWKLHIPLALAVILVVTMEICFPLTIKFLVDHALIPHDRQNLLNGVLMLVLIVLGAIVGRYITAVVSAYMLKELNADLRIELIHLVRRLPMSYLDNAQPGQFSILFDTELGTLARTVRDLFSKGFYAASQFAVIILTLVLLNWQLALVAIFLLPFMVIPISYFALSSTNAVDSLRKGAETVNSAIQDHAASQVLARAFGVEQLVTKRFVDNVVGRAGPRASLRHFSDVRRTMRTPHFVAQIFSISMDNIMAGIMLIVVSSGVYLTFAGTLTLGTFSAFILLLPIVMRTFSGLSNYIQELGRATLSLRRFEQLKNAASADMPEDETTRLPEPDRAIRFEQVSFGYNKESPLLRDVNLTLPIGQSVAFVGRSGSGKSTLFRLILGFYHPTTGRVLIDDHDVRRLAVGAPGSRIGTVLQPSILTNGTIRENIGYAKPDATNDEIEEAARMADIHDFIAALPNGYESRVGDGGRWLSEGQRPRIALARAILPRPGILLLDEVTASRDPATEAAINATIRKLAADRTVILVTHRLAAAAFMAGNPARKS